MPDPAGADAVAPARLEPPRPVPSLTGALQAMLADARRRLRSRGSRRVRAVAATLMAEGRFAAADIVLRDRLASCPDDDRLLEQYACCAQNSGRHVEAVARWERCLASRPDAVLPWCGIAANERSLGRFDRASATIAKALARFPDDYVITGEAARVADARGEFDEALVLWRRMLEYPRVMPEWHAAYVNDLAMVGRLDEAAAALAHALASYPDDLGLHLMQAVLRAQRDDHDGAIDIIRDVLRRHPDDEGARNLLGRTLLERDLQAAQRPGRDTMVAPVDVGRVEDADTRALLLGFESIGCDCEFGLVQRRFGAEPLGLLRWNSTSLATLVDSLSVAMEGLGAPDRTLMTTHHNGEYFLMDRLWGFWMHTFVFKQQVAAETLFPKMCGRIAFLRDKLLEDLRAAEKIVVFKAVAAEDRSLDALTSLHAALSAFGPVRLLFVTDARPDATPDAFRGEAGDVVMLAPNLYAGLLRRQGLVDGSWCIGFDDWIAICRKTAAMARRGPVA